MKLVLSDLAKQEFDEIISYYRQEANLISNLFLVEAIHSLKIIQQFPSAGSFFYKHHQRFIIKGFPYYVVYHILQDCILVTAFAHQHRRPFYWNKR